VRDAEGAPAGAVRRTEANRSDPSPALAGQEVAGEDGISHRTEKQDPGWRGTAGEGARPEQEEKPADQDGYLKVPDGPGIGVTPGEAGIKESRMLGELN